VRTFSSRWKRPINVLAVGPGWVASGNNDYGHRRGGLEVWSIPAGEVALSYPLGERVHAAFDPAGRLFLSSSERLQILDLPSGRECPAPRPSLYHPVFALSSNGSQLLVSTALNQCGALGAWVMQPDGSFHLLWQEEPQEFRWFDAPILSADGRLAAVIRRTAFVEPPDTLLVLETACREPFFQMPLDRSAGLLALRLTDSGLLLGLTKRAVRAWDARTGQLASTIRNPVRKGLTALAVHPGGRWIATADSGGTVRFLETERFRPGAAFDWQTGPLRSIAFSPDVSIATAGTDDGRVVVWDVDP
jgi:hypothetical protein